MTALSDFTDHSGAAWLACENLQSPVGGIALVPPLVPSGGAEVLWLPKTHEQYEPHPDESYYLGLGKAAALQAAATRDALGAALLSCNASSSAGTSCFSWADVERALPPIRKNGPGGRWPNWEGCDGVRTFVGSRGASGDATFSDYGEDCSHNGFPSPLGQLLPGYSVINLTAVNTGEGPILNWTRYINFSAVADGLVGGSLPVLSLTLPVLAANPYHALGAGAARYWTMIAAPVPDGGGRREQDVWFRFQQIDCTGGDVGGGAYGSGGACVATSSQHWQNYWWSRTPGKDGDGSAFGPKAASTGAGFYRNLLRVHAYWQAELAAEGGTMMSLSLPAGAGRTNGTMLAQQAVHGIVRSMVSRRDTWHPAYGVEPGYGWQGQDGFQDVFTSTATMALEWGAFKYARGVIDNQFRHYVRVEDGMVNYRATEVPATSRFLTVLAQYWSYTRDKTLLLEYFPQARAVAEWLSFRRNLSLSYARADPRYGIPFGDDEADDYAHNGGFSGLGQWQGQRPRLHYMSSAAEMARGFEEMGAVWAALGAAEGRADLAAHGAELLTTAPLLQRDLHASLNATLAAGKGRGGGGSGGRHCWAFTADDGCPEGLHARTVPEMMYSAMLRDDQIDDLYRMGAGAVDCSGVRNCSKSGHFLQVGCPSGGTLIFTHIPFGLAFGMLLADFPDRFLLHYFSISAHAHTRGSWTTPESSHLDREHPTIAYATPGPTIAPTYLRWALAFEDPRKQTLWLAKALPREWLLGGRLGGEGERVEARGVPTRYGTLNMTLAPSGGGGGGGGAGYSVRAALELPPAFAPPGGLRLRLRAPLSEGSISAVSVGGKPWSAFDAAAETVDFAASDLTPDMLQRVKDIVVGFN